MRDFTQRPINWIAACVLPLVTGAFACKPRYDHASTLRDVSGPIVAEDLLVLFPVGKSEWPTEVSGLDPFFVQLQDVLPLEHYIDFLGQVSEHRGDLLEDASLAEPNPLARRLNRKFINRPRLGIPIDQWYVTGVRLVPCQLPYLPLPTSWLATMRVNVDGETKNARDILCRPYIRIVAQRFSRYPDSKVMADDKSIHLVAVFTGGQSLKQHVDVLDQAEQRFWQGVEVQKEALSVKTIVSPGPKKAEVAMRIADAYQGTSASWLAMQREFRMLIQRLSPDGGGALRIPYSRSTENYKAFLRRDFQSLTAPKRVALNFGSNSKKLAFSQIWTLAGARFGDYQGSQAVAKKLALHDIKMTVPVDDNDSVVVNIGRIEGFNDVGGSSGFDKALVAAFTGLPMGARAKLFLASGLANVVHLSEDGQLSGGTSPAVRLASYRMISDPVNLDLGGSVCTGCHIASAWRITDPSFPSATFPHVRTEDPDHRRNLEFRDDQISPVRFPDQTDPHQTWVMRLLGYFGQTPCIGDRVAQEVRHDLAFLRRTGG